MDEKSIFPTTFKRLWRDTEVEMPFEISTAPENCSRDALKICWKDLMASNLFVLTYWFMDVETMTRKLMMIMTAFWKPCFRDVLRETLN